MSLDCAMAIQKSTEHSMINHCDGRITQLGDIQYRKRHAVIDHSERHNF